MNVKRLEMVDLEAPTKIKKIKYKIESMNNVMCAEDFYERVFMFHPFVKHSVIKKAITHNDMVMNDEDSKLIENIIRINMRNSVYFLCNSDRFINKTAKYDWEIKSPRKSLIIPNGELWIDFGGE